MSAQRPPRTAKSGGRRQTEGHAHEDHAHAHDDHGHGGHAHNDRGHDGHDHDGHGHDHDDHGHDHGHDHGDHGHDHPTGIIGAIKSIFVPHSHDPADSIAGVLAANREGVRALKLSLLLLGITAVLQVGVVAISDSVALLADTIHNFADALTAVPLAVAFWFARRPFSRSYTHGYGRAEDLAGVFVVLTITFSAVLAAWQAIDRLVHPKDIENLGWVAAAGVIGFIGNEVVAVYRIRVGRRIGSAALVADGLHARTDGITSLAVVLGAVGVALGFPKADPIVGLGISAAIFMIAASAARDIYRRLMDAVDPYLVDRVEEVVAGTPGVTGVERVAVRWVGHELAAEAEILSSHDLSVAEAHAIAEEARHRLLHALPRLSRIVIHTSPDGPEGTDHHAATTHHLET
jgi:cation diffusion facilitator family transporter